MPPHSHPCGRPSPVDGRARKGVASERTASRGRLAAASRLPGSTGRGVLPAVDFERKDEKLDREARAKEICRTCPVKAPCLDYAIQIREPHGIWGGLNEAERQNLAASRA